MFYYHKLNLPSISYFLEDAVIWLSPLNQVTSGTGMPRTSHGMRMVDCGENSVVLRRITARTGTDRTGSVRHIMKLLTGHITHFFIYFENDCNHEKYHKIIMS